jgi:hypothetical protein
MTSGTSRRFAAMQRFIGYRRQSGRGQSDRRIYEFHGLNQLSLTPLASISILLEIQLTICRDPDNLAA